MSCSPMQETCSFIPCRSPGYKHVFVTQVLFLINSKKTSKFNPSWIFCSQSLHFRINYEQKRVSDHSWVLLLTSPCYSCPDICCSKEWGDIRSGIYRILGMVLTCKCINCLYLIVYSGGKKKRGNDLEIVLCVFSYYTSNQLMTLFKRRVDIVCDKDFTNALYLMQGMQYTTQ